MSEHRPHVELHIERLVLDGIGGVDRANLGAAVQVELARLLTERGVPTSLSRPGHAGRVDGGRMALGPDVGAPALGTRIAEAIYRGFQS